MDKSKALTRVDLNLLVILDLLLKERNVSRVAEEIYLTQSAVSRSLKRLREAFDDPLFTRNAKGLIPTRKALELEKELNQLLPSLLQLFESNEFDAKRCDDTFSLSLPTFIGSSLIPKLYVQLSRQAPLVSIEETPTKANPFQLMDANKLDYVIHYEPTHDPKYHSEKLGSLYPVLYVRKGHPLSKHSQPSIEEILSYSLIGMTIEDDRQLSFRSPITQVYQDLLQTQNKPKLRSSQTLTLLEITKATDSVLFGSNSLKKMAGFNEEFIEIYSLKEHEKYHVPMFLIYHSRHETSQAHQWFYKLFKELVIEIM
ncbi:LysR family transcriptional regulator [Vibrio comitans]|uniref:LysR family transcriptional regulator n=1 Tax=Vibrio comitans NBRC 102076 TaxID=1219078 RepID=A0A4Y3IIF2_9VIBR|nr:LysR family transcriptional regulator [Vibrio comitans]GEA59191.1 LysR family transcriptional regulator [Vibrio comitans NBRC 102076]